MAQVVFQHGYPRILKPVKQPPSGFIARRRFWAEQHAQDWIMEKAGGIDGIMTFIASQAPRQ